MVEPEVVEMPGTEESLPARRGCLASLAVSLGRMGRELFGFFCSYEFWRNLAGQAFAAASMAFGQGIITYFRDKSNVSLPPPAATPTSAFSNASTPRSSFYSTAPVPAPFVDDIPWPGTPTR